MKIGAGAVFGLWLGLTACGEAARETSAEAHAQHADAEFVGCPASIPAFALGMRTSDEDGTLTATVRDASPIPPARFFNDWVVELEGPNDTTLGGATIHRARAFMPVHGHYGTPDPRIRQHESEPAVFDIDALNLFMRGPWQILLSVESPDAGDAELMFEVCVEE